MRGGRGKFWQHFIAVLAHISLSRPRLGGGGERVLIKKNVKKDLSMCAMSIFQPQSRYATKKCRDEMRRDSKKKVKVF